MDTRKMQDAYSLEIKGSLISYFFLVFSSKNVQKSPSKLQVKDSGLSSLFFFEETVKVKNFLRLIYI